MTSTTTEAPHTDSTAARLKTFFERIERLDSEKAGLAEDIKQVFAEAKGQGYETKIMKEVLRLRKLDTAERQERETLIDLYMSQLGMGVPHTQKPA